MGGRVKLAFVLGIFIGGGGWGGFVPIGLFLGSCSVVGGSRSSPPVCCKEQKEITIPLPPFLSGPADPS